MDMFKKRKSESEKMVSQKISQPWITSIKLFKNTINLRTKNYEDESYAMCTSTD